MERGTFIFTATITKKEREMDKDTFTATGSVVCTKKEREREREMDKDTFTATGSAICTAGKNSKFLERRCGTL